MLGAIHATWASCIQADLRRVYCLSDKDTKDNYTNYQLGRSEWLLKNAEIDLVKVSQNILDGV